LLGDDILVISGLGFGRSSIGDLLFDRQVKACLIVDFIDFDQMGLTGEKSLALGFIGVAAISGAFVGGGEDFDRGDNSACGYLTDFEIAFFDFPSSPSLE
jgi:hypothetical protein